MLLIDLEINIAFMFRIYITIICVGALDSSISKAKQEKEDAPYHPGEKKSGWNSALDVGMELSLRAGEAGCICFTQAIFGSVLVSQVKL